MLKTRFSGRIPISYLHHLVDELDIEFGHLSFVVLFCFMFSFLSPQLCIVFS